MIIDSDEVVVIPTPGHTSDSVSVRVRTKEGVVVISGDLFEKEEDLKDSKIWKDAGSENQILQEENRQQILAMADFVIPGHGEMFKVSTKKN